MFIDMPLEQLQKYAPARQEPKDFDAFWQATLADARNFPLNPIFEPIETGLKTVQAYDVTYNGFGGQAIKGWLILPGQREWSLPCIVEYIGYGGGRSFAIDWLLYASAGYAHFVMDTRGQGSTWRRGDTPDDAPAGSNPQIPGFMTRGILNPQNYYYRRVFTDAVRAIEAARAHPAVDPARIGVTGGSQGGGISIAAAALADNVSVVMPDVPFLCNFRRALEITDADPYGEIIRYLHTHRDRLDTVYETLTYFDGMNFAARAHGRALFSTGLLDEICPPSTVYAAFNHYAGPKEIRVWHFNNHEGGESYQAVERLKFLKSAWG